MAVWLPSSGPTQEKVMHRLMLALGISILLAPPLLADGTLTGTIQGTITSSDGEALPGTSVTLGSEQGSHDTRTDAQGQYRFGLLAPGPYTVTAELEGLGMAEAELRVGTGQRRTVDLTLRLATAGETIQVVSEVPLVNKYDVSTTTSMAAEVTETLAFASRSWQSVLTSMPGVYQNARSQYWYDHRAGVNGQSWQDLGGFIDGVDTSFSRLGGSSQLFLPSTVISEVRIEGSGYTAEYGRVTGGIANAMVKSGTNRFHGDFRYIPQSQKWRAEYDAVPLPRNDEIQNSYETALGGPMARDKAWFFVSYSEDTENVLAATGDQTPVDSSNQGEVALAKLNFQPGSSHSFYVMGINAPHTFRSLSNPNRFDVFSVPHQEVDQELAMANWNWTVSSNMFLETRAAAHRAVFDRSQLVTRTADPNASPDDTAGNVGAYWDLNSGFRRLAIASPLGTGQRYYPRNQANSAFSLFAGVHELKFGADWQVVNWETLNNVPDRYQGRNFDANAPGGFEVPVRKRVYLPSAGLIETESTAIALFVQDRLSWGDHWSMTVGLRVEDQEQKNDIGDVAASSTDLAPRLAAVYDASGNGRLLFKGTVGRYYHHIAQEVVNDEFTRKPNGVNAYNEFGWNSATGLYDIFRRTQIPALDTLITDINPYYKDEVTLGVEWQFSDLWAFKARGIFWDHDDLMWPNDQFAPDGSVFRLVANYPEGQREYQGLQLELNRSFRNNWVVRSNYTLGRSEGNLCCRNDDDNPFLEGKTVVDPVSGIPLTAINYFGRTGDDREHVLNLSASRTFQLGNHSLNLGGFFWFRSGEWWGRTESTTLRHPSGSSIRSTTRPEPRDANQMPDLMSLNMTLGWHFPLGSVLEGSLRVEAANLTNEQESIRISTSSGRITPVPTSYQVTREYRFVAGIRF